MSGGTKRERPGQLSSSFTPKRPRRAPADDRPSDAADGRSSSPSLVMVTGLPADCSVLELKTRLEMYGPISRTRIDLDGSGYITFRSDAAAEAAIAASLDHAFGITIRSKRVLVIRASEPPTQWKPANGAPTQSKLLRPEIPLRKHGRSIRKLSPGITSVGRSIRKLSPGITSTRSGSDSYKGREIVAYDDLL